MTRYRFRDQFCLVDIVSRPDGRGEPWILTDRITNRMWVLQDWQLETLFEPLASETEEEDMPHE